MSSVFIFDKTVSSSECYRNHNTCLSDFEGRKFWSTFRSMFFVEYSYLHRKKTDIRHKSKYPMFFEWYIAEFQFNEILTHWTTHCSSQFSAIFSGSKSAVLMFLVFFSSVTLLHCCEGQPPHPLPNYPPPFQTTFPKPPTQPPLPTPHTHTQTLLTVGLGVSYAKINYVARLEKYFVFLEN